MTGYLAGGWLLDVICVIFTNPYGSNNCVLLYLANLQLYQLVALAKGYYQVGF